MEFIYLIITIFSLIPVEGLIRVTNLQCESIDKPFSDFDYCYIRAVNRTYTYVSLKVKLFKVPITNVTLTVDVRKRANGYKPFLYNVTFDACKFLKTKNNPLYRYMHSFIAQHSNMNHTCPYDHDLILEKLDTGFMNNQLINYLPAPEGEYAIFTTWTAYNIPRAHVNIYASLS